MKKKKIKREKLTVNHEIQLNKLTGNRLIICININFAHKSGAKVSFIFFWAAHLKQQF